MSDADMNIEGMRAYIKKLTKSPDRLLEQISKQAARDALQLAVKQRMNCSVGNSEMRESIEAFCYQDGDTVTAGTKTDNRCAALVEFGAGPESGGQSQPAEPFMYPAMKEMAETLKEHLGAAVKEVLR